MVFMIFKYSHIFLRDTQNNEKKRGNSYLKQYFKIIIRRSVKLLLYSVKHFLLYGNDIRLVMT